MKRLPVAAFAVLVALTVAAFFITQHLKTVTPLVLSRGGGPPGPDPAAFNPTNAARTCPNNEGEPVRFNKTQLRIKLQHSSEKVEVFVVNPSGDVVDTLSSGRFLRQNAVGVFTWNGRNASGRIVRHGTYYFRIELANGGGEQLTDRPITVITKDPTPKITGVRVSGKRGPAVIEPGSSEAQIHFKPGGYRDVWVRIYRTTASGQLTLVTHYRSDDATTGTAPAWNGLIAGKPVPAGTYLVGLQVKDAACNLGTTPASYDVVPGTTAGHGVTVRYVAAMPPLTATPAGSDAAVFIDARSQPYKWQLRAVGARKVLERGSVKAGGAQPLHVRIPGHQAGLYELTVAADNHSTTVPLVAAASGHAASAHMLVVLPMLTWQGNDPVDDDGDGLPNTLAVGDQLKLPRLLVSGLPAGFADSAQLLAYLNSQHVSYQLTTDVALALGQGPSLKGRKGVLFDGSSTWLPSQLGPQLRSYVEGGGRVATIGLNSMQAQVKLTSGANGTVTTGRPEPLRPDPFGVHHGGVSSTAGGLVTVQTDALGLFGGTDAFPGFDHYQAITPPAGAHLSLAGLAPTAPAVIAFTLGSGQVVEVGLDGFVNSLVHQGEGQVDSQELMANIIKLLGGT